jgi:hypothetical protein
VAIWLCRNDANFDKKILLVLAGYFQGYLWDLFLKHPAKGEQQITCEVGLSHIGDLAIEIFAKHE